MGIATVHLCANSKRKLIHILKQNVIRRKEMKKDAITRQVINEEPGEDEFFTVQVKIKDTKTASTDIKAFI